MLRRDEGRVRHAYQDHLGYWTIGVGRLIDQRKGGGLSEDEIDYLLTEANTLMPEAKLTLDDVIYTYSGVRPLPYAPGVSEWKIPRSHIVLDHADTGYPALFSVVGGKLTTYRQLAEDATDIPAPVVRSKRAK